VDYARALDEELVVLVSRRDERALERLYEKYGRAIYSLVLRMLRDPGRAEEVAQEVFLKVWRRPASYVPGRGPFATWLLSVAHHRAVDELRARRHDPLPIDCLDGAGADVADERDELDELAWLHERRRAVRGALAVLPEPQRAAIELAYFGGLTQREIADRLGEPLGTIKTRMRLAMQKLRGALNGLTVDGEPAAANGHDHAVDPELFGPIARPTEAGRVDL
jgi:RNA polymerase sigma-70 factor (ECF subfamily)